MIIYHSGVHRPCDVKLVRQVPVKLNLMGMFFDVVPNKHSKGGVRMMRRLFRKKGYPTW